jgi:hypothetical protein
MAMRPATILLTTLAAAIAGPARAADFEGRAEYRLDAGARGSGTVVFWIGPAGLRSETQGTVAALQARGITTPLKMTSIVKAKEPRRVYLVDDEHKTYTVVDGDAKKEEAVRWTVARLGTDTVAGYACQRVRVDEDGEPRSELCITQDLGRVSTWITAQPDSAGLFQALAREGLDGLPVRWSPLREGGQAPAVSLELVKATREPVPAEKLEIPAGYTKRPGGRGRDRGA